MLVSPMVALFAAFADGSGTLGRESEIPDSAKLEVIRPSSPNLQWRSNASKMGRAETGDFTPAIDTTSRLEEAQEGDADAAQLPKPSESDEPKMVDTGMVLKALPNRSPAKSSQAEPMQPNSQNREAPVPSASPYALPVTPASPPFQIGLFAWGERGFLQLRLPTLDPALRFQLSLGGTRTIDNGKSGEVRSRQVFSEVQGRFGLLFQPMQEQPFMTCNLDFGMQVRGIWSRSLLDSNKTYDRWSTLTYEPMIAKHSGVGVQPYLGIDLLFWLSPGNLAVQTELRTGPEWIVAGSYSGFRLHSWISAGLVFTP